MRPDRGRRRPARRISEHHHGCRQREKDKAVHAEEVRDAAFHVAELAGRRNVNDGRLDRDGDLLTAADRRAGFLGLLHIGAEILRALLVQDVVNRARCHQYDHDDQVSLHDGRCDRRRNLGEGIAREH